MNKKLPTTDTEKSIQELYSENPNLVTIQKAANALKVSKDTLRRWEAKGKITSIRTTSGYRLYDLKTLSKAAKSKSNAEVSKPEVVSKTIIPPFNQQTPLIPEVKTAAHSFYEFANLNPQIVQLPSHQSNTKSDPVKKVSTSKQFSQSSLPQAVSKQGLRFYTVIALLLLTLLGTVSAAYVYLPGVNQSAPAKYIAGLIKKDINSIKPSREVAITQSKSEVLAASSIAKEGKFLQLNLDTNIVGNLAVEGEGVFTENITAPNILYSLNPGTNITITGDPQNPTISTSLALEDATYTTKGIASFSSTFFTVTDGAVTIADGSLTGDQIDDGTVTNSNLANSSITINAGSGLSGGGTVSLGGSITLTASGGSVSGVSTITGTADQVIASASTGDITLSLPQSIGTTSDVEFDSLELTTGLLLNGSTSGTITVAAPATVTSYTLSLPSDDGTNGYVLQTDGLGNTSWVAQSGGASSLQDAYDGGNTIATTTGRNLAFTLSSGLATSTSLTLTNAGTASAFVLNDTNGATNTSIEVQSGGSPTLTITEAGTLATSGNISTSGSGTITSAGTLTASNGFTMTTGALSLTSTSGSISSTGLSGLTYTLSSGTAAITAPTLNLNTSSTGNTAIGNATGTFSLTSSGLNVSTGGTITGATWNGTAISTQYGGTGQNFSATAQGSLPYFSATGTFSALAPSTAGYVLTTQGAGANPTWTDAGSLTVRWNTIDDPNANQTLAMADYTTTWNWATADTETAFSATANALTSGTLFNLSSTSTAGAGSGNSFLLDLSRSGTNSNASHTAYGVRSQVTNTGTTSTNIAGYFSASGASTNYALYAPVGNMYLADALGIGTGSVGTYKVDFGTGAYSRTLNVTNTSASGTAYGAYINKSGAATTGVALDLTSSGATNNYALQTDAMTAGSGGSTFHLNLGTTAGASSATFGAINTGAISGAGTTSYGLNLGANSSTATTNYGVNIGSITGAGTTNYGLAIGTISGAASNYAIYAPSGYSYFGGSFGIGSDAPSQTSKLAVVTTGLATTLDVTNNNTGSTAYGARITKSGAATTGVGLYVTSSGATNNYAAIFDAGRVGIGDTTPDSLFDFEGAISGTPSSTGAWLNYTGSTFTDSATSGSGTATTFAANAFGQPTLAATNSNVTTTNAATVYIANAPAAGSNQTITAPLALLVDSGAARFDGHVGIGSGYNNAAVSSTSVLGISEAYTGSSSFRHVNLFGSHAPSSDNSNTQYAFASVLDLHSSATASLTGTVTAGLFQITNSNATQSIGTAFGSWIGTATSSGGAITNNYGLFIDDQTVGSSDYGLRIDAADTQTLWVGGGANGTTASAGIAFGSSRDTNLYRSAADTLKTDDAFTATGLITGSTGLTITGGTASINASGSSSTTIGNTSSDLTLTGNHINASMTLTDTSSGAKNGLSSTISLNPSGSSASQFRANSFSATVSSGNVQDFTDVIRGVYAETRHLGTGSINIATGVFSAGVVLPTAATSFGTITEINAFHALPVSEFASSAITGTVSTARGIYIENSAKANSSWAMTTQVGIDVSAMTSGSSDIGVRIAGADTYSLQLSSTAGTAASGITFGTDTNLYRSAADTLKTDDAFNVNGNLNITSAGAISAATGITSSGTITFSGLSADSGVYTTTGGQLTTTPPSSGTLGYWSRTGTTLSTANSGDDVTLTSVLSTGAKSTYSLDISQANDGTFNNSVGLLSLANSDTGSTAAVANISQAANGVALAIDLNTGGTSSKGISFSGGLTGMMIDASTVLTTSGVQVNLAGHTQTSGSALRITGNASSYGTDFSGSLILVNPTRILATAGATRNESGNYLKIARSNTVNNGTATINMTGSVADLSSNCTQTLGTCNDSSNILSLTQSYASATGSVLAISNSGSAASILLPGTNSAASGLQFGSDGNSVNLYRSANDTLKTDDAFNVNGNLNITSAGAISAATGITSSGTITFSGLSADSGVYTTTGGQLTTTPPSSGTLGYWSRSGTTLSPANSGDAITTSGNISTTGSGTGTFAGLLTATSGLTLGSSSDITFGNAETIDNDTNGILNFAVDSTSALKIGSTGITSIGNVAHSLVNSGGSLALDSNSTATLLIGASTNAKSIFVGNNTGSTNLNLNSGTGAMTFKGYNATGNTTSSAFVFDGAGVSTGTGIYITSTATSGKTVDINASQTSGTVFNLAYGSAKTLSGDLIGLSVDLNSGNVDATNQNITGVNFKIPTVTDTHTTGTKTLTGMLVNFGSGAGINQNGAGGTLEYVAGDFYMPALTQSAGTLNAYGARVTTPATITTGGTAYGNYISATGVGAGTLSGLGVSSITGGSGSEYALNIGSGWDAVLRVGSTTVINGSGVTVEAGGGTGQSTYSTGDILYASGANTLAKRAIGNSNEVLTVVGGVPTWATISGASCSNCVITDPTSDQTIAPTGQGTTGLTVRQTSTASPTDDIFQVTSSDGTTKYFYVDKDGNVSTSGTSGQTLTLTPLTNTTALTLVGTNVTSQPLQYVNSKNESATNGIINMAYGAAQTLTGAVIGIRTDLSTNVTATNQSVTGYQITLPGATNTSGTQAYKGIVISGGSINENGGTSTTFTGADITIPALTQTSGTLTAYGANVTTPSSITTGGTAYGYNVAASGVGAGTLYGLNISNITGGAGTEVGAQIGSGWDTNLLFNDTSTRVAVADGGTITILDTAGNSLCTITDNGSVGDLECTGTIGGSGTVGFWSRDAGTGIVSPSNANDVVAISSNKTSTPLLNLTSTGSTSNAFTLTGNSITTGNLASLTGTGFTTGEILDITGTWAPSDGSTNEAIDINITHTPTSLADNFTGLSLQVGDGSALNNTVYGGLVNVNSTGNAAKTMYGFQSGVQSSSTTADTLTSLHAWGSITGAITTGTRSIYGIASPIASTAASTGGTQRLFGGYFSPSSTLSNPGATDTATNNIYGVYTSTTLTLASDCTTNCTSNQYGLYVDNGTSDTDGTSAKYGIYINTQSGADTNYALYSAATAYSYFAGNLGIGTSPSDTYKAQVGRTMTSSDSSYTGNFSSSATVSSVTDGYTYVGMQNYLASTHSANAASLRGLDAKVYFSNQMGSQATVGVNSSYAVHAEKGITGSSPTGTISNAYGLYSSFYSSATGTPAVTVSNNFGLYVTNQGTASGSPTGISVTNAYGLYVAAQSGATTGNYAAAFAGGNVGIGDTTPAAALTVGSSDAFQVNSSGAIAAATGITSSGTINFSGLSASSGVYTDGSKNLTSTPPSSGTIGYWSRSGTTLSTATANDIVSLATTNTTGADLGITNTGVYTGTGIVNLTANSATTGNLFNISATGMTTGEVMNIDATWAPADGSTNDGIDLNFTHTPTASADNFTGLNLQVGDSTTLANTVYGGFIGVNSTGNAAKTLYGFQSGVQSSSTAADTLISLQAWGSITGALSTGTRSVYGVASPIASTAASTGGTLNLTGGRFTPSSTLSNPGTGDTATNNVFGVYTAPVLTIASDCTTNCTSNQYGLYAANGTSSTNGTSTKYGLYVEPQTGADNNYGAYFGSNIGIGDSSPTAALTVGSGDLFQVNSSGAIAAITGYTQASGAFAFSGGGNFSVDSAAFDVNTSGAISGVTTLTQSGLHTINQGSAVRSIDINDTAATPSTPVVDVNRTNNAGTPAITNAALYINDHSTNYLLGFETGTTDLLTFTGAGQLSLPVSGSGAGIVLGGDTNLYRSAADTLRTDDAFNVGGNFNVTAAGVISGATGLTSSGTINFSGLTASSAVYTDASKNLTSTAPTSGTIGYWSRSSTTLSPATAGDVVLLDNNTAYQMKDTGGVARSLVLLNSSDMQTFGVGAYNATYNGYRVDITSALPLGQTTDSAFDIKSSSDLGSSDELVQFGDSAGDFLTILGGGNVGIGDSSPAAMFTVGSSDAFQINSSGNIANIGGAAHTIANSSGALGIDSATTGAINIGTSANAKTITVGNSTGATALAFTSGTGSQTFTSSVATTSTTSSAFVFTANSLTSGTGAYVSSSSITTGKLFQLSTGSANTLSSGTLADIRTTSTALTGSTGTGSLLNLDWSPGSSTTATGDLFSLNIGSNGTTTGKLFNILDSASSIFSVSETSFTTSLPSNFTAAGDTSIAYDINFTNPTASYIESIAPLYVVAGETFNSSNLNLQTYNFGSVVVDSALTTGTGTKYNFQSTLSDATANANFLYGVYSTVNNSSNTSSGTHSIYGGYFSATSKTTGTTTAIGVYGTASGGDNNFPFYSGVAFPTANTAGLCWDNSGESAIYDCNGTPTDLAENYGTSDSSIEAGDVVAFTGEAQEVLDPREGKVTTKAFVKKSNSQYQNDLVGIVSTNPNQTYGEDGLFSLAENPRPVSLTGRVPVKVSTENGPIAAGDYLTSSSTPGVAMKSTQPGVTIGRALSSYTGSGVGKVIVYVKTGFADPNEALANLLIGNNGQLLGSELNLQKITVATTGTFGGLVSADDYKLNADNISRVGVLASLPVDQQNRASVTDALNLLAQAQNSQESRITDLQSKEASTAAALADAKVLGEQALNQTLSLQDSVASTSASIASLSSQIDSLLSGLGLGESSDASEASDSGDLADQLTPPTIMFASDSATLDNLTVNSQATISGQLKAYEGIFQNSLKSLGDTFLGRTNIAGDLSVDGTFSVSEGSKVNALPTLYFQTSALAEAVDFFNGLITINKDGALAAKEVVAEQFSVKADSSAGQMIIQAGETEIPVLNQLVETDSIIILTSETAGAPALAVSDKVESTGFVVKLGAAHTEDIKVSYLIVGQK